MQRENGTQETVVVIRSQARSQRLNDCDGRISTIGLVLARNSGKLTDMEPSASDEISAGRPLRA
jgi:hypothetical protein